MIPQLGPEAAGDVVVPDTAGDLGGVEDVQTRVGPPPTNGAEMAQEGALRRAVISGRRSTNDRPIEGRVAPDLAAPPGEGRRRLVKHDRAHRRRRAPSPAARAQHCQQRGRERRKPQGQEVGPLEECVLHVAVRRREERDQQQCRSENMGRPPSPSIGDGGCRHPDSGKAADEHGPDCAHVIRVRGREAVSKQLVRHAESQRPQRAVQVGRLPLDFGQRLGKLRRIRAREQGVAELPRGQPGRRGQRQHAKGGRRQDADDDQRGLPEPPRRLHPARARHERHVDGGGDIKNTLRGDQRRRGGACPRRERFAPRPDGVAGGAQPEKHRRGRQVDEVVLKREHQEHGHEGGQPQPRAQERQGPAPGQSQASVEDEHERQAAADGVEQAKAVRRRAAERLHGPGGEQVQIVEHEVHVPRLVRPGERAARDVVQIRPRVPVDVDEQGGRGEHPHERCHAHERPHQGRRASPPRRPADPRPGNTEPRDETECPRTRHGRRLDHLAADPIHGRAKRVGRHRRST